MGRSRFETLAIMMNITIKMLIAIWLPRGQLLTFIEGTASLTLC